MEDRAACAPATVGAIPGAHKMCTLRLVMQSTIHYVGGRVAAEVLNPWARPTATEPETMTNGLSERRLHVHYPCPVQ